jgi:hypothetical protein
MNNKDEQDNINEMLVRSGDHLMNRAAQYREQPVQVTVERKDFSSRYRSVLVGAAASIAVLVVGVIAINGEGEVPSIQIATGSVESPNAISSDSAMRLSGEMIFTLADGVDIAGAKQDVWKWGNPTESDAKDLAQRLGVTDQVRRDGEYGALFQAGNLTVMANGSWSYYEDSLQPSVTSCVMPTDSPDSDQPQDSSIGSDCVVETPPDAENLPTDSEARAKTLELLGDGFRVNNVMRSAWDVTVDGTYLVNGKDTSYWGLVGFADQGRISSASGLIGEPSNVGKYKTISASEALPRLNSGMFMAYDNVRAATDEACPSEAPCTTTITFTSVRRTYTQLYDSSNIVWIVPAYEYSDASGGTWTAMALDDSYLEKAVVSIDTDNVPAPVEPMPFPLPGDTGGGSIEPGPIFATSAPIGLSELEAIKVIESEGFTARVVARDGESLPTTKDYNLDRVNISIENGVVVSAELG